MLRSVDKGKVMVLLLLNGHTDPRTGIRSDDANGLKKQFGAINEDDTEIPIPCTKVHQPLTRSCLKKTLLGILTLATYLFVYYKAYCSYCLINVMPLLKK